MATQATGSSKGATNHTSKVTESTEDVMRKDVAKLFEDVRAALDELAVRGDLATMEGRDLVRTQAAEVEARWWDVKKELGLVRSDTEAAFDALHAGFTKAEQAVRHVLDAVVVGVRKP